MIIYFIFFSFNFNFYL